MRARPALALLTALLAACTDGPVESTAVQVRDSAGVRIVTHEALIPGVTFELSSEPELWIQGDERIPPFDRIGTLKTLADESVLVPDRGANRIHRFSSEGDYLWSAGREGDGPGEFRSIGEVFVAPGDTILVADGRAGRLTFLSPEGRLLRTVPYLRDAGSPVGRLPTGELLYASREASVRPHPACGTRWSIGQPWRPTVRPGSW